MKTEITREEALAEPKGFTPSYDDLLEAVRASCFWAEAENQHLGTFDDRMNLGSYAEWCCDKALGRPHSEEWEGVPRIVLGHHVARGDKLILPALAVERALERGGAAHGANGRRNP